MHIRFFSTPISYFIQDKPQSARPAATIRAPNSARNHRAVSSAVAPGTASKTRNQPLIASQFRITKRRNTGTSNPPVKPIPASSDSSTSDANNENLFMYIDLHGHASKKGIFMYGNHMAHNADAVECMLLPRLMSMNCPHFHFDSCVFSEKNMYST